MDNEKLVTDQLESLFSGLGSGLNSLREVRETYDEEVAFDFNPLQLFQINENTVTDMLAYFLNPKAKHGQKDRLLRAFLQQIGAQSALELIDQCKSVKVSTQSFTDYRRPIDAVITIGDNDFIVGIENKVWGAVDQQHQIRDYIEDIKKKAKLGKFQLLYFSPDGSPPSKNSIDSKELENYEAQKQFKVIPFCGNSSECSILSILKALSDAARADSVRAFIKFMITYFEKHFEGGTTVNEQKFIIDYIRKTNGNLLSALNVLKVRDEICSHIWNECVNPEFMRISKEHKWKCKLSRYDDFKNKPGGVVEFYPEGWSERAGFFFGFASKDCSDLYFGVRGSERRLLEKIKQDLNFQNLNPSNTNRWFMDHNYSCWSVRDIAWADMLTTSTGHQYCVFVENLASSVLDLISKVDLIAQELKIDLSK